MIRISTISESFITVELYNRIMKNSSWRLFLYLLDKGSSFPASRFIIYIWYKEGNQSVIKGLRRSLMDHSLKVENPIRNNSYLTWKHNLLIVTTCANTRIQAALKFVTGRTWKEQQWVLRQFSSLLWNIPRKSTCCGRSGHQKMLSEIIYLRYNDLVIIWISE